MKKQDEILLKEAQKKLVKIRQLNCEHYQSPMFKIGYPGVTEKECNHCLFVKSLKIVLDLANDELWRFVSLSKNDEEEYNEKENAIEMVLKWYLKERKI